jgi:hypothetical protein
LAPWSTENCSAHRLPRHQRAVPPTFIQLLWISVCCWLASVAGTRVVCQNCGMIYNSNEKLANLMPVIELPHRAEIYNGLSATGRQ